MEPCRGTCFRTYVCFLPCPKSKISDDSSTSSSLHFQAISWHVKINSYLGDTDLLSLWFMDSSITEDKGKASRDPSVFWWWMPENCSRLRVINSASTADCSAGVPQAPALLSVPPTLRPPNPFPMRDPTSTLLESLACAPRISPRAAFVQNWCSFYHPAVLNESTAPWHPQSKASPNRLLAFVTFSVILRKNGALGGPELEAGPTSVN